MTTSDKVTIVNREAVAAAIEEGLSHQRAGRLAEAEAIYRRVIEVEPDNAEAHNNLGVAFTEHGKLEDAVAAYHGALELKPNYVEAHNNLGATLTKQGKLDEAEAACLRAIAVKPDFSQAYYNLSFLKTYTPKDSDIRAMEGLVRDPAMISDENKMHLFFALGKAYEDTGCYDKAFECFTKGNLLKRSTIDFNIANAQNLISRIIKSFTKALFTGFSGVGYSSDLPIFIVGMPRSATTLVEQILASHPGVHGAGELKDLNPIAIGLQHRLGSSQPFPECVEEIDGDLWRELGEGYVDVIRRHAPAKRHISDKMPSNYQHIGLIHLMLPNARIIHCERDPLDTCLSCYKTLFTEGQHFSYDLTELARYYREYDRLMRHWRTVLPGRVLNVRYEDVVFHLEGTARRLVEFCGLEWDSVCLEFYKTERPVRTASAAQVRRPIYASSVEHWRHYERHLEPLIEALGPCAETGLMHAT